jgi:hypothetical protein
MIDIELLERCAKNFAWLEAQFATKVINLHSLSGIQVFGAGGEAPARILHQMVEPEGIEIIAHIYRPAWTD